MLLTLGEDRRLARKLLQYLRRARQPVPRLPNGAVKHQLVDLEVPHRVGLGLGLRVKNNVPVPMCQSPCADKCT